MNGHLGCFHLLDILNNAAISTGGQVFESLLSIIWGINLGMELLGNPMFNILRNSKTVFTIALSFYIPSTNTLGFQFNILF